MHVLVLVMGLKSRIGLSVDRVSPFPSSMGSRAGGEIVHNIPNSSCDIRATSDSIDRSPTAALGDEKRIIQCCALTD